MEFRLQRTVRVLTAAEHATGAASREYWRGQPPAERLAAVEFLRRQHLAPDFDEFFGSLIGRSVEFLIVGAYALRVPRHAQVHG